ncbi:MAG: hypothetical protein IKS29_00875 [Oscillospiraceae bacterium]|nr:hypothetical protein [Oscillospiraceae bacterium]
MIHRGVSLYSYQQNEFFHTMNWKDEFREVATNLRGADGIEIISECTIPHYPFPPESFIFDWRNELARWGLKAVTMDTYLDTLQFRDHVMSHAETAERLKYDLELAHKMGFRNMRLCHNVPLQSVEMVLDLAEKYDIRMTNEIHAPSPIKPKRGVNWGETVARDVAFIQKTGTKHYGLQPDMGIFQHKPNRVMIAYSLRATMSKEDADKVSQEIIQRFDEMDRDSLKAWGEENYPTLFKSRMAEMLLRGNSADPLDLYDIFPYIYCIHGKFYEMTEIPGEPGHYEEKSMLYPEVIGILSDLGYDGYIDSEYEGQRSQQDMGYEGLPNEVEEVRRHHEMMARLIENSSKNNLFKV